MLRRADRCDLPRLQDVERAAGAAFRDVGMAAVADDEPPPLEDLAAYADRGRAWVVTDADDEPIAYLLLDVVDGAAHVEQVSVHPAHARRGVGRRLLDAAAAEALAQGFDALTLTTFAEVPWNAPYYARLGFAVVPEDRLGPELRRLRRHERERGLDAWPRVVMRRPLAAPGAAG